MASLLFRSAFLSGPSSVDDSNPSAIGKPFKTLGLAYPGVAISSRIRELRENLWQILEGRALRGRIHRSQINLNSSFPRHALLQRDPERDYFAATFCFKSRPPPSFKTSPTH